MACSGLLVVAAAAAADTRLGIGNGVATLVSEDVTVGNDFVVSEALVGCPSPPCVRFSEPVDPLGIIAPVRTCSPGSTSRSGNPVEVFCTRAQIGRIALDSGPAPDRVRIAVPLAVALLGGTGADELLGGVAADRVDGGQGDDRLDGGDGADELAGGAGADVLAGGRGDDALLADDGEADTLDCGDGADRAVADQFDAVGSTCEAVERRPVTPPADVAVSDGRLPLLRVRPAGGSRVRETLRLVVRVSEPALVQASGFLRAGGRNRRLPGATVRVGAAGRDVALRLRLPAVARRAARRDLRRGRRPSVRVALTAVDPSGSTSAPRRVTIRLRAVG